ncbi:MAG: molybdopterin-dependent oxidoreductase [Terracidiphilus sp.]|jgi:DMSO/TMAO reductase YedYZ molybdopterin-dependent catalytic subunit
MSLITRRRLITTGLATAAGVSGLGVAAKLSRKYGLVPPDCKGVYGAGETLTYAAQRLLIGNAMAREFPRSMISEKPFANPIAPPKEAFKQMQARGFVDWKLTVDGMVEHPMTLSLADLKTLPVHSQITEVSCEEGWSYIAEWIGTPLSGVLNAAGLKPGANYIVYSSIEPDSWDSLDISEAMHPQTLLAMGMNDGDLPVGFGGPLRMRVPRQLGYKNVKFINHITATDSMKHFGKGLGSVNPEYGYAWFAGI